MVDTCNSNFDFSNPWISRSIYSVPTSSRYRSSPVYHKIEGWGVEILIMIGVQKCQFLAKPENSTNAYAYCSSKLIVNNECLVYVYSLDFIRTYSYNKNCMIPYFINLISDRDNFAVGGPTSF